MIYRGYDAIEKGGSVIVSGIRDFDADQTFDCGQCFRWSREPDGSYTGVAMGRVVNISCTDGKMEIKNSSLQDFKDIWYDYLDLGRNYSEIKSAVSKDDVMRKAVAFAGGIRLLRQELWETLVSFIISANNRIPMIKRVVASICHAYGEELRYDGRSWYTFPRPEALAACSLKDLELCKGGFRCKYILETAKLAAAGGFDLKRLYSLDREEARTYLTQLPGVGYKVADCTLLFSGIKLDVFPTDVWVKRVVEELYFKREASFKEIWRFAQDYFGGYAGFAQEYLFYYARENRIGA